MSAAMGGNVRVGLEDSLWLGPGKLAESNAAQVRNVVQIIEGLGLEVATPDDAREILELKGGTSRRVLGHGDAVNGMLAGPSFIDASPSKSRAPACRRSTTFVLPSPQ